MTDRELMQQALDALLTMTKPLANAMDGHSFLACADAVQALRARLAQPEPEQQLEWDEVFDCATTAYCRSSASKETLRLCFQHRNPQQEQVAIPWTANELMDFAKGIASIYNTPPVRQADSEPVAFICQGNAYMADDVDEYCRAQHTPLYTAPPQREWVGLTDEEIKACCLDGGSDDYEYARAIEAKLKEKNHA